MPVLDFGSAGRRHRKGTNPAVSADMADDVANESTKLLLKELLFEGSPFEILHDEALEVIAQTEHEARENGMFKDDPNFFGSKSQMGGIDMGVNALLPVYISKQDRDVIIDFNAMIGYLGPLLLMTFVIGNTLNTVTFGAELIAACVVVGLDWDENECKLDSSDFKLNHYWLLRIALGVITLAVRVGLQTLSMREMNAANHRAKVDRGFLDGLEDGKNTDVDGERSNGAWVIDSVLRKRRMDIDLQAGLEMMLSYDRLTHSWLYRAYQILYIPELGLQFYVLSFITRLTLRHDDEHQSCTVSEGAGKGIALLVGLGYVDLMLLLARLLVIVWWIYLILASMFPSVQKAGLKRMQRLDKTVFFGVPIATTFFVALYGSDEASGTREERLVAALAPMKATTGQEMKRVRLRKMNKKKERLGRQQRRLQADIDQLNDEMSQDAYRDLHPKTVQGDSPSKTTEGQRLRPSSRADSSGILQRDGWESSMNRLGQRRPSLSRLIRFDPDATRTPSGGYVYGEQQCRRGPVLTPLNEELGGEPGASTPPGGPASAVRPRRRSGPGLLYATPGGRLQPNLHTPSAASGFSSTPRSALPRGLAGGLDSPQRTPSEGDIFYDASAGPGPALSVWRPQQAPSTTSI